MESLFFTETVATRGIMSCNSPMTEPLEGRRLSKGFSGLKVHVWANLFEQKGSDFN